MIWAMKQANLRAKSTALRLYNLPPRPFDAQIACSYHRQQARTHSTPGMFTNRQDNPVQTRDEIRLTTLASCAG
jgi:hypothetical protein